MCIISWQRDVAKEKEEEKTVKSDFPELMEIYGRLNRTIHQSTTTKTTFPSVYDYETATEEQQDY